MRILKAWCFGTCFAGICDILAAFLFAGMAGHGPATVLRGVAAGPFGERLLNGGLGSCLVGLGVHFFIMSNVVAAFISIGILWSGWHRYATLTGIFYGIVVYLVMYCAVLPLRYPNSFPQHDPAKIAKALLAHICCIGLPIAWTTQSLLYKKKPDELGVPVSIV
jgi:hypothetical protein